MTYDIPQIIHVGRNSGSSSRGLKYLSLIHVIDKSYDDPLEVMAQKSLFLVIVSFDGLMQ